MCEIVSTTLMALSGAGAGAGAATGAMAGAATLKTIGTVLAVGGSIYQGVAANQSAKQQAKLIEEQKQQELVRNATQDQRERRQFFTAMGQQRAEQAGRGVALDSPTAVYLGQIAAREMSFQSQSTRQTGQAIQTELSAPARAARARGTQSLLKGSFGAAGALLNRAPDLWPELLP